MAKKKNTNINGIARRWLLTSLGVILVILAVLIMVLSLTVRGSIYGNIESVLRGRSVELTNVFGDYGKRSFKEFNNAARNYVENFTDKEKMELMVLDSGGKILITSIGFVPDSSQPMPDYYEALEDSEGYGVWTGRLTSGEKVMAVTRVIHNSNGNFIGAIRYVVSLELADRQVMMGVLLLLCAGALVVVLVVASGLYFVNSIITPIKQISAISKRIAQGDFGVRILKTKDDEIGQLCDNINEMAVELGKSEKMKNDFISSISHELRTPLTAIKGWAETMQEPGIDTDTCSRGMNIILHESERLSGIVEELLEFSSMQSGRMTLVMDKIDLLAELEEAVYMFSERAKTEHKFLVYEETPMLPPVLGDVNRLRQVFVNIIDNALKYTDEGGTVNVAASEDGDVIHVVISDNGCGIPAEHLPNIKRKFYKANQTVRGSGIGLALADEIMKLHNGSLDIESHENVGTAVMITIPILKQDDSVQRTEEGKLQGNA